MNWVIDFLSNMLSKLECGPLSPLHWYTTGLCTEFNIFFTLMIYDCNVKHQSNSIVKSADITTVTKLLELLKKKTLSVPVSTLYEALWSVNLSMHGCVHTYVCTITMTQFELLAHQVSTHRRRQHR